MIEFQTTYRLEPFDPSYHPVNLPRFDNVKLAAVATCPTYGIMRYQHHKVYASPRRPMPLIAGLAAHDAFAAIRLGDLYFNGESFYGGAFNVRQIATEHAIHLFGKDRATDWVTTINRGEDLERSIMLGALDIFESSGYYDDPDDKRRTIANIEETIIAYCARYPLGKIMVFVGLDVRQKRFVGIEVPLDMFLHIEHADGVFEYRFTGRVDAVMWPNTKRTHISIEDDKTASRLNEAWHESWKIAHQPTGYCLGIGALLDAEVNRGVIRGASIPLPKTYDYGGIATVPFIRSPLQFIEWADHVVHIMSIVDKYNDKPLNAPRYTVSCNKYFRPCNYIPFCDSSVHERGIMFNEMDTEVWDPLFGTHYEDEEHDS